MFDSRSTDQSGFTIVELLVATAMMIVVTGAAVSMLVSAMNRQPKVSEGAQQIGTARNAVAKLVRDVRQGSAVSEASATGVTLSTYCPAAGGSEPCQVTYACGPEGGGGAPYRCTRSVDGTTTTVVTGLGSDEVFSYGTAHYVGVRLELPASSGSNATVIENGAALHNASDYRGSG